MISDPTSLHDLLRAETETAASELLRNSGQVSAARIRSVERLARLVQIRESQNPPPARRRWGAPVLLAVTLACVSVLLFMRLPQAEVEMDVRLAEIGLRVSADTVLLRSTDVVALGVAGAREISIRRTAEWPGVELAAADDKPADLEITSDGGQLSPGITLAPIHLKKGTRAWIQPGPGRSAVRLVLEGDEIRVEASLGGTLRIAGNGARPQTVEFKTPKPALFLADRGSISLDLSVREPSAIHLSPELDVDRLLFYRAVQSGQDDRRLSSVVAGSLYLGDVNGREEKLRQGQELRFRAIRGRIRRIQLQSELADMQFNGVAEGLETGTYENPRSLMPTWLEWLHARHGLSLLWASAIYVFGLALVALRWLRVRI